MEGKVARVGGTDETAMRPLRADARRNREALLRAAGEAFAERGVDTSLEDIAVRAEVGIGTLYRNFPTREALIQAVYQDEVEWLCGGVEELLASMSPEEALRAWTRRFVDHVTRKRGMATALKQAVADGRSPEAAQNHAELVAYKKERMEHGITTLVDAGVASGTLRSDVAPMDLLRSISGICLAETGTEQSVRMASLLTDGMRFGAAG